MSSAQRLRTVSKSPREKASSAFRSSSTLGCSAITILLGVAPPWCGAILVDAHRPVNAGGRAGAGLGEGKLGRRARRRAWGGRRQGRDGRRGSGRGRGRGGRRGRRRQRGRGRGRRR